MMKEREEMVRVANERRRKKLEEREKAEAKAFRAAQMRMVRATEAAAAASGSSEEEGSSSDSEDSLENFGLSEEEIARRKSHKRNAKMCAENRVGFVSELRKKN